MIHRWAGYYLFCVYSYIRFQACFESCDSLSICPRRARIELWKISIYSRSFLIWARPPYKLAYNLLYCIIGNFTFSSEFLVISTTRKPQFIRMIHDFFVPACNASSCKCHQQLKLWIRLLCVLMHTFPTPSYPAVESSWIICVAFSKLMATIVLF